MSLTVKILLTAYFVGHLLYSIHRLFDVYDNYGMDYFLPSTLYKKTKMNKFGCVVCSIFLFIINYLYCSTYLLLLLVKKTIWKYIYWLFTVGRKDEEDKEDINDNIAN